GPAAASPVHTQYPDELGETGHGWSGRNASFGSQRRGWHSDGRDHLPHGGLQLWVVSLHTRPGGDRRGGWPPGPSARHRVRSGAHRTRGGGARLRRPPAGAAAPRRRSIIGSITVPG